MNIDVCFNLCSNKADQFKKIGPLEKRDALSIYSGTEISARQTIWSFKRIPNARDLNDSQSIDIIDDEFQKPSIVLKMMKNGISLSDIDDNVLIQKISVQNLNKLENLKKEKKGTLATAIMFQLIDFLKNVCIGIEHFYSLGSIIEPSDRYASIHECFEENYTRPDIYFGESFTKFSALIAMISLGRLVYDINHANVRIDNKKPLSIFGRIKATMKYIAESVQKKLSTLFLLNPRDPQQYFNKIIGICGTKLFLDLLSPLIIGIYTMIHNANADHDTESHERMECEWPGHIEAYKNVMEIVPLACMLLVLAKGHYKKK